LQIWRIDKAAQYIPPNASVLDVGCFDGTLFQRHANLIKQGWGIDMIATENSGKNNFTMYQGKFPNDVPSLPKVDVITMLAVVEHIPINRYSQINKVCCELLNKKGLIIITIPSPLVDYILNILIKLHLIDGMSFEEHQHVDISMVPKIFSNANFELLVHKKFQLGLNNLFIFRKI
jgi:2-polyprenyl-3-methyl-5-hydroxy-6-metoxy-1,4-benzoquinol methylase